MSDANPPGPKGQFLIGNLRQFADNRLEYLQHIAREYGDIVFLRFGPRKIYFLNHPDYVHYVLVKHPEKFNKSPLLKKNTRQAIGDGLLTSDGEFHARQRRLVQPAFHTRRISAYADVMVDYTQRMLATWEAGEQRDISHEMMELTMQIVAKVLFDADVSGDAEAIGKAITIGIETVSERVGRPLHLPEWVPTAKNRARRQASALLDTTIMQIINDRRASGEDRGDLLSMLLLAVDEHDGGQMTNKQVRDEAMTLFIAGHETTANALAWTLYLLAQHPEVEAKLLDELTQVLGDRAPGMADLPQLAYTEMVIKESMRLYPPAWVTTRLVVEEAHIGEYAIPKDSICILSPYTLHRDARYFAYPERFDPERFAPGYEERIPKYAYFPFGGGPRVCIGNSFAMMEAQLLLATMLQRFHLTLVPGQNVRPEPLVTLRAHAGIQMQLMPRAKAAVVVESALMQHGV